MTSLEIVEALEQCELFRSLDEQDIAHIAALCNLETYEAGESVFTQGEFATHICLIAEGQVALVRSVNLGGRQGTLTVDLLGKGRGLGWSSILCVPCHASASAICQKQTVIVSVDGAALREVLEHKPSLGFQVMDNLAHVLGHRLRAVYGAIDTFR